MSNEKAPHVGLEIDGRGKEYAHGLYQKRGRRQRQPTPVTIEGFPLTDTGNAERFALDNGDDVRFCFAWAKWIVWDGKRWRIDDAGMVEQKVKQTVRSILRLAAETEDDYARKMLTDYAKASESLTRRNAMLTLAQRIAYPHPARRPGQEPLDSELPERQA